MKNTRDLFLKAIRDYGRDNDGKAPNCFVCHHDVARNLMIEAGFPLISGPGTLKFMEIPVYPDSECDKMEVQAR